MFSIRVLGLLINAPDVAASTLSLVRVALATASQFHAAFASFVAHIVTVTAPTHITSVSHPSLAPVVCPIFCYLTVYLLNTVS